MNEVLLTNLATILIALFAGHIALYQVKSNVISVARIKWIKNLRKTLSQYCCELENCSLAKLYLDDERKDKSGTEIEAALNKFYFTYSQSAKEVLKLQSKIFLYLNSQNPQHKRIEELGPVNSILLHEKTQIIINKFKETSKK